MTALAKPPTRAALTRHFAGYICHEIGRSLPALRLASGIQCGPPTDMETIGDGRYAFSFKDDEGNTYRLTLGVESQT